MEHVVGFVLLSVLGVAGLSRLIPLMLEDLLSALERSLALIGRAVQAFRAWRRDLWPHPPNKVP